MTGYIFSRGPDGNGDCPGDHLGIGGTFHGGKMKGRLLFFNGDELQDVLYGGPVIEPKTWHHVRLVRQGDLVSVYLNSAAKPIFSGKVQVSRPAGCHDLFLAGRSDNFANFEGRIADAAIYPGAK